MESVNLNLNGCIQFGRQKSRELNEGVIRAATYMNNTYQNFCMNSFGVDGAATAKRVAMVVVPLFLFGCVAISPAGAGVTFAFSSLHGLVMGSIEIFSSVTGYLLKDVAPGALKLLFVDLIGGILGQAGTVISLGGDLVGLIFKASITALVAMGALGTGFGMFKGYQAYRGWQNFLNPPQAQQQQLQAPQVDAQHQFLNAAIRAALDTHQPAGEDNEALRDLLNTVMQNDAFKNVVLQEARQGKVLEMIGNLRVGLMDAVNGATDNDDLRDQLTPFVVTVLNAVLANEEFMATLQPAPAPGGAQAPQPNVAQVGQQHVLLAIVLGRFAEANPIDQDDLKAARATIQNNMDFKNAILHALRFNQPLGADGALRDALDAAVLLALPGDDNQELRGQFTPIAEALVRDALQKDELKAATRPMPAPVGPAPMPYPEGDFNIRHVYYLINQLHRLSNSVMTNLRDAYLNLRHEMDANPYVRYGVYGLLGATAGTITVAIAAIGLMIIAGIVAAIGRMIGTFLYAGWTLVRGCGQAIYSLVKGVVQFIWNCCKAVGRVAWDIMALFGRVIYAVYATIRDGVYMVGSAVRSALSPVTNGIYNLGSSVKESLFGRTTTTVLPPAIEKIPFPVPAGPTLVGSQVEAANKLIGRTTIAG